MTKQEAIEFGTDRLELFGGQMEEFIKMSVEALKEQRPKGHWIPISYDSYADGNPVWDEWECSECGYEEHGEEDMLTCFCPDCGADMREVES